METDNEKYNEAVQPNTAFLNELREKLPEFFTKDGSFDLDKFKRQLKNKNVNELRGGYQLNFIGKDYARRQAGEMPSSVIVPDEKQNKGAGVHSNNLFFTGDNLEVLRHLQNSYQNEIDVIYIDPPYNTGSDGFAYPDSFEYTDNQLKNMFSLSDDQVERLKSIQGKSSHSAWLTFMYPRLVLAKKVLKNSGTIFVSIDDNEQSDLKSILDEIFGEGNFIKTIANVNNPKGHSDDKFIAKSHEYILVYAKAINETKWFGFEPTKKITRRYNKKEQNGRNYREIDLRKTGENDRRIDRPNMFYYFYYNQRTNDFYPSFDDKEISGYIKIKPIKADGSEGRWRWGLPTAKENINNLIPKFMPSRKRWGVMEKDYLDERSLIKPTSSWTFKDVNSERGTEDFVNLGFNKTDFMKPKPVGTVQRCISLSAEKIDSIVLDFFAGSGTTAESVMRQNLKDGGKRKFILVQLDEPTFNFNKDGKKVPTKGGKTAYESGFNSIDEIARERIRRAANKIENDNELTLPEDFDGSFKHYRVVKPSKQTLENIDNFNPNNTNLFTNMVEGFSSNSLNIPGNTSGEQTILTTWLIQDGYPFDAKVEEVKFNDYIAHKVEDNRLYLISEGWTSNETKKLLNQLGTHKLNVQSVVIFGYSFNVAELRELENGLKQLDSKVTLLKRY